MAVFIRRLCNRPMIPHGRAGSKEPLCLQGRLLTSLAQRIHPFRSPPRRLWSLETQHGDKTYEIPVDAVEAVICTRVSIDAHSLPRCRSQTASKARRGQPWSAGSKFSKEDRHPWNMSAIRPPLRRLLRSRFWPPGSCLGCHVSWTGLKQCPDSPQQSSPGSVMEGVNAEVWLAPLAAFTVVSRPFVYCVSALLQITARIPSWHHGAVDLSAPRPTVRFASAISDDVDGGQSSSGQRRPDTPCNPPSSPCFPTNSAIPGLPSYTGPQPALRHQHL